MKIKALLFVLFCNITSNYSQVGIGTTTPNATLDVEGKPLVITEIDGFIPPRISRVNLINKVGYGIDQTGTLIYITSLGGIVNTATENITSIGYYYFDSVKWKPLSNNNTHYLGEDYLDGIIFELYRGDDGLEHGLIVAKTESSAQWQTPTSLVNSNRTEDGAYNTALMTNSPAAAYVTSLGAGWYLPSIDELSKLYYNRYYAQKGLRSGGFTILSNLATANYWSSNEFNNLNAFFFTFYNGISNTNTKVANYLVRGVKAF